MNIRILATALVLASPTVAFADDTSPCPVLENTCAEALPQPPLLSPVDVVSLDAKLQREMKAALKRSIATQIAASREALRTLSPAPSVAPSVAAGTASGRPALGAQLPVTGSAVVGSAAEMAKVGW